MRSEPASERRNGSARHPVGVRLLAVAVGGFVSLVAALPASAATKGSPAGIVDTARAAPTPVTVSSVPAIMNTASTRGRQFGTALIFVDAPADWAPQERNLVDILLAAARVQARIVPPLPEIAAAAGRERLARVVGRPVVPDTRKLEQLFDSAEYRLDRLAEELVVPRVILARLPEDLDQEISVERRKSVFLRAVLPAVLAVNEEIERERERLTRILATVHAGRPLDPESHAWLEATAERYDVDHDDLEVLARRIDVIPPSLALAQAAEESGWGTSRFARQGNALFGQRAWSEDVGLVPRRRVEGAQHVVRNFDSLLDSARAYAHNLNTHPAYRDFRILRAERRSAEGLFDGASLATSLERYSERGTDYIDDLHTIIRVNDLARLDASRLQASEEVPMAGRVLPLPPLDVGPELPFAVGSAI